MTRQHIQSSRHNAVGLWQWSRWTPVMQQRTRRRLPVRLRSVR